MKNHQTESGDPAFNRGKAPHKGGYHAGNGPKRVRANSAVFKVGMDMHGKGGTTVKCPWNPGRSKK